MSDILSATAWPTNAHMIRDVAALDYLHEDWRTLDPTYGKGVFWKLWRPKDLVIHDIKLDGVDFRALPHEDGEFQAITFDPPYKLNGTPDVVDERYGVHVRASREDRYQLIREGIDECSRVLAPKGYLLLKCQDQVNGGKVRWQTRLFADYAESKHGMTLVDSFLMLGHRPQPDRGQVHARHNYSTLLVLRAPK